MDEIKDSGKFVEAESVEVDQNASSEGKIYCANCIHCKLVTSSPDGGERYYLRVRCTAGKWRKRLGEEKVYKYCTVVRRSLNYCDAYEDMGDSKEFLRDLKRSLPVKDELYLYNS